MSEPSDPDIVYTEAELVGGPCGMTNAQAALIAASISTAKYDPRGIVLQVAYDYKAWLDDADAVDKGQ